MKRFGKQDLLLFVFFDKVEDVEGQHLVLPIQHGGLRKIKNIGDHKGEDQQRHLLLHPTVMENPPVIMGDQIPTIEVFERKQSLNQNFEILFVTLGILMSFVNSMEDLMGNIRDKEENSGKNLRIREFLMGR